MTDINEMLDTCEKKEAFVSNDLFDLLVRNEKDYNVFYTQPGLTAEVTLAEVIENGNFPETLGIDPNGDLHFKRARSRDGLTVAPVALSSKFKIRETTLGELGFNRDGFDTLTVNTDGANG